jgi:solute carrier family 10 (sodium/bile acid cotransporter), member 7
LRRLPFDWFLVALVVVVALAVLWPQGGAKGGFLHIDWIASYGIALVFLLYGLTLAPEKLRQGMGHWRVHITVQLGTFVLFPIVVLAAAAAFGPALPPDVWTGFFFVAAVPSTVSSSVAMTSLAKGNVPVAIFNATLSSLIGVFLTPILMAWFVSATGGSLPLGPVVLKVVLLVLLPVVLGQIGRIWFADWAKRNGGWLKFVDRFIILAIVYGSFSDSIVAGVWNGHDAGLIVKIVVGVVALFFVVYGLMMIPCRLFGFNREDTIATLFCASKKSLATGVPMATVMFGTAPALGLIIAPLMLYHFCQLVIVSVIASRYAASAPATT